MRDIARWASVPILLMYLFQAGATTSAMAPDSHDDAVACCETCDAGGPCCCLAVMGRTSCDLVLLGRPLLQPVPCGGTGSEALMPAAATAVDHLLPQAARLSVPPSTQMRFALFCPATRSVRLGPPDKIPIV